MIGTYKELYKFTQCVAPFATKLWEDFHNRKDPQVGDLYRMFVTGNNEDTLYSILHTAPIIVAKFVKVEFDSNFKNGVAFYYIFDNEGKEIKVHSINDVEDPSKLTTEDFIDLYAFWRCCEPVNN